MMEIIEIKSCTCSSVHMSQVVQFHIVQLGSFCTMCMILLSHMNYYDCLLGLASK